MDEREAMATMTRAGKMLAAGTERALPDWAESRTRILLGAWGRHSEEEQDAIVARVRVAAATAGERIAAELEALFGLDPDEQRRTPLQIIRTLHREVTPVLRDAGVPPIVRDEFEERALPDDDYGLSPRTLADLGDEELADLHLTWGAARAMVHKARRG